MKIPSSQRSGAWRVCPMLLRICLLVGAVSAVAGAEKSRSLPNKVGQLVVVLAEGWDAGRGTMQCFQRGAAGWIPLFSEQKPVLLGKSGLAWGRGILPVAIPLSGERKTEGDGRSPAGVFEIGRVFGYAAAPPSGTRVRYRQVTEWDCWVEDEKNPHYNRHVVIDPSRGVPSWFRKERMRMEDAAHSLKLEIRHNTDPPQPGMGSAIFFHIRRGPERMTAGCATMKRKDLIELIQWLNPAASPHCVLLPRHEYLARKSTWKLPSPRGW